MKFIKTYDQPTNIVIEVITIDKLKKFKKQFKFTN